MVVRASHVDAAADKDILLIGTMGHVGQAASLLSQSPYRVENGALRVAMSDALPDIWHLAGSTQADTDRAKLAAVLTTPLSDGAAAMIGAESPLHEKRSVVAVLAGAPQGLISMAQALRDEQMLPHIQGDLALLNGGTIAAYRVGGTYTVGHLPIWLWPEWLLQDRPLSTVVLLLGASMLVAFTLYRLVRGKAHRRIAQSR
jgi:cellulose synthase (UDP-forming)